MSDRLTIQKELLEQNSCLAEQSAHTPYMVPDGYFDCLAETILTRIRQGDVQEELGSLSPLLQQFSRTNPYSAPAGYFERTVEISVPKETPVISLLRSRWIRYAVASVAVFMGLIIWLRETEPSAPPTAQGVITKYKEEIQQLDSNKETLLQEFMAAGLSDGDTTPTDAAAMDGNGWLADVSEQEINEFLELSELISPTVMNN